MKKISIMVLVVFALSLSFGLLADKKDKVDYKRKVDDPILKKIEDGNDKNKVAAEAKTSAILKKHADLEKIKETNELKMRFDMSEIVKPTTPEEFKSYYHFAPVAQYYTGTCWSYSQTSFLESELFRIHGKKIKLSEMFTVYYEYIEKALGYLNERGNSYFAEGSEADAVLRAWKKYGVVPYEVYDGIVAEDGLHNHVPMHEEMESFLEWAVENEYCDETLVVNTIKTILNRYLGEPPTEFEWEGKKYTPKSFLKDVVKINPDDYVQFQSTLSHPFYVKTTFDVPDNWWFSDNYYNVPLEDFMSSINHAIESGYTICIGGDVSEPGYNGWEEIQVVPTFDIPQEYINQDSREYRIYAGITEDDHGIHMVGYLKKDGHYWYLIKDSARSARQGKHKGYHFYRDDYVKLKMLTYCVHKDAVKDLLNKVKKNKPESSKLKLVSDGQ